MNVIVAPAALIDIVEARRWWEQNRRDAPDLLAEELAATLRELPSVALSVAPFRRVAGLQVRRIHVPRVHRHIYFHVAPQGEIVVLAVWGAVRRVLPGLRERVRSAPSR